MRWGPPFAVEGQARAGAGFPRQPAARRITSLIGRVDMIGWAVTFFVIALIAAVLGFSGIAGTAVNIAWALAVIGIILAIVFAVMGRRPPI
jgi:uncharacterized membrane protein YtjA (UPF0391 family)